MPNGGMRLALARYYGTSEAATNARASPVAQPVEFGHTNRIGGDPDVRKGTSTAHSSPGEIMSVAQGLAVRRQPSAQPAGEISELRGGGSCEPLEIVLECSHAFVAEFAFPIGT